MIGYLSALLVYCLLSPSNSEATTSHCLAAAAVGLGAAQTQPISFWPIPTSLNFGAGSVAVDPALKVTVSPAVDSVSNYANWLLQRYVFQNNIGGAVPAGAVNTLTINVANPGAALTVGVDESYQLAVNASGAFITAGTPYGAFMGLQTLGQAIRFSFDEEQYGVAGTPLAISDAPKFAWRGMLIDTDRHWLSLHHIFRIIDSMTFAKMNSEWSGYYL